VTIDALLSVDLRPHINQDKPQTPEQVFSTNYYHKTHGSGHLCTEAVNPLDGGVVFTEDGEMAGMPFVHPNQTRWGVLNLSDCGTGKTRGVLDFLCDLKMDGKLPPVLVLAPLSILEPAWGGDIHQWTPNLTFEPCYNKKRLESASIDVDIHLFNHDAVKWLMKPENDKLRAKWKGGILVIDEFTAFKNMKSQRTQAAINLAKEMSMTIELSGTPVPRSVIDIFTPALIADGGHRLGNNFYRFQHKMCTGIPMPHNPRIVKWEDKPDAMYDVTNMLSGMVFRFKARGVPLNTKRHIKVKLPAKALRAYKEMVAMDLMYNEDGTPVSAVNAGARYNKLIQLCSGAVYDSESNIVGFHKERYELVATLIQEVEHSVVAFNFKHERKFLEEILNKLKVTFAVIDGSVNVAKRVQIVEDYQAGKYTTLLCHPQSAGHGLTFTKGTRTIWCSPTNNAEYFIQYNKRIDRKGQVNETETIMVSAEATKEADAYDSLFLKVQTQAEMLSIFACNTEKDANI
jgi:hypothetical protein